MTDASALKLGNLRPNPGAKKKARRVGRGPGGRGKTSGRGQKGQRARRSVHPRFEGGQTPMHRRMPKRGFSNPAATPLEPLNLERLQLAIDKGEVDPSRRIDMKILRDAGLVAKSIKHGVKLLARGNEWFAAKVDIEVTKASEKAIRKVESLGGTVTARYFNRLGLRAHLKPDKFASIPAEAAPPPKIKSYYQDPVRRGYLAPKDEVDQLRNENASGKEASVADPSQP